MGFAGGDNPVANYVASGVEIAGVESAVAATTLGCGLRPRQNLSRTAAPRITLSVSTSESASLTLLHLSER